MKEQNHPPKISGLIFDLDGTLLDTLPDLAQAVNFARARFHLPALSDPAVGAFVGDGVRKLLERAFANTGVSTDAAYEVMAPYYRDHLFDRTRPYEGVAESLTRIDLPMAVITNKLSEYVKPLLDHFDLTRFFKVMIGGDTLPQKKPDPLALGVVSKALKVTATEFVMVGDSRPDLEFARNGGIRSVFCAYGYGEGGPAPYTWKIGEFKALLEILD